MGEINDDLGHERAVAAAPRPVDGFGGLLDVDLRDPCAPDEDDERRPRSSHQHRFADAEFAISAARSFHGCGDHF